MKNLKSKIFMVLLLLGTQPALINCAKSSDNGSSNTVTTGNVYTAVGVVPQSTAAQCGANYMSYGYYNGQCYPITSTTGANTCSTAGYVNTSMGCLPQSSACGTNYTMYGYLNGQCYPVTSTSTVGGTCQAGYVGTQFGCEPQSTQAQCGVNFMSYGFYSGVYNSQSGQWCVPRTY